LQNLSHITFHKLSLWITRHKFLLQRTRSAEMQKKRSSTSHSTIRIGKLKLFSKFLVFLVSILFLTSTIYIKEALAQSSIISSFPGRENLDYEILELYRQLKNLEVKIIPIDTELKSLIVNHDRVINEITQLKQELRGPRGVWSKITGVFSERKLRNLLAESQDMSDRITILQKDRSPLVKEFITLSDRLIGRSEARILTLMDVIIKNESGADKATEQISATLQLTRRVTVLKNKYASDSPDQVKSAPLLSLTNDPEKLRLGARLLRNTAIQYRADAEKKRQEIKNLQASQRRNEMMIDKLKEIQRSNEEKESSGGESGTTNIPSSFNESETRRKIEKLKKDIDRLSNEIHELDNDARNMDNQSIILEQKASQIEATPKGK
jgi:predicted RecB family endonuclease